jgi:hypothetical protein
LTTEKNLYLYLTGDNHVLTVNGEDFIVTWDEATGTFAVTPDNNGGGTTDPEDPKAGTPGSGDLDGDGYVTMADLATFMHVIIGQDITLTPAQLAAVDMDSDGYLTMADLLLMSQRAVGL